MANGWTEDWPWRRVNQPYVVSTDVMRCPSNTACQWNAYGGWPVPRGYNCNGHDQYNAPMGAIENAKPIAAAKSPAQCVRLVEANEGWTEMNLDGCWSWFDHGNAAVLCALFAGHMGNTNFAFCDGHVKAMKPNATASNSGPVNMWACDGPNVAPFGNSVSELQNITQYYNR